MKKIIVSVTNDLTTDQRVHRTCTTLIDLGFEVVLIGRELKDSLPVTQLYKTKRMRLVFNNGFLFYAEYTIKLFFFLLFNKKDVLLSNDVDTLLPNYLIHRLQKKPLLFDSHELFSEVPELIDRPFVKSVWKKIEATIIPKLTVAYTVSNSIALYYKNKYNTPFEVVRNVPFKSNYNQHKSLIKLNSNSVIYQGALNKGRGLALIIEAMQFLPDTTLYLAGEGDLSIELRKKVTELNLAKKVVFLGKVSPSELSSITPQAAVGISLEEDLGLNYRFALPNKLFDYIQAQIPVLVSDLPEMAKLVNQYELGEILKERTPKSVANQLKNIIINHQTYTKNLLHLSNELCWENEKIKLIDLLKRHERN